MAQTEQRAGFRLWGREPSSAGEVSPAATTTQAEAPAQAADAPERAPDAPEGAMDRPAATPVEVARMDAGAGETREDASAVPRGSTRFLAELARAMQAAANDERARALEALRTKAKEHIERVQARAATEVDELKKRGDDEVAAVREWSKAEIARIREETERRIAERKADLEHRLEDRAPLIEREIERVQASVTGFEREMTAFFEQLTAEVDPGRIVALAGRMPEPPSFERGATEAAQAETPVAETPVAEIAAGDHDGRGAVVASSTPDPGLEARLAPIGITPDLAVAEREAVADAANVADANGVPDLAPEAPAAEAEPLPEMLADSVEARLAHLVPPIGSATGGSSAEGDPRRAFSNHVDEGVTEQVIVLGLTSVASIAGFKRHLGRLDGVKAVGVSSGPDGEFIFKVTRDPAVTLHEQIPTLPGFAARVNGYGEGVIRVAARDPEAS